VSANQPERPRLRACVEAWPDAHEGGYDPRCCRFPKSCSADVYDPAHVTAEDLECPAMTAPEPTPTAEHIDAVARAVCASEFATGFGASEWDETITNRDWYRDNARAILTSTDAAVHAALAASLPAEVKIASLTDAEMLAALVRAGVLTAETARPCACPAEERSPWGGLVESASNCAYCAAAPEAGPCSLHREAQR